MLINNSYKRLPNYVEVEENLGQRTIVKLGPGRLNKMYPITFTINSTYIITYVQKSIKICLRYHKASG